MDEDIAIPLIVFGSITLIALGLPLVRAYVRRQDRAALIPPTDARVGDRLERIEGAVDAIALEVERIAENQRYLTRVLSERPVEHAALPNSERASSLERNRV